MKAFLFYLAYSIFWLITLKYLNLLEDIIRERPELYLWTHKRWKYQKGNTKNPVDI